MEEETTAISTVIADLEEILLNSNQLLSLSNLQNLQSLLDDNSSSNNDQFFKSIPPSSVLPPLTSTMVSGPTNLSLSASNTYLSLLLSPNSPVFSLFTPISFLSLLSSLRRSLKLRSTLALESASSSASGGVHAKKRKGRKPNNIRGRRKNNNDNSDDEGTFGSGERQSEFLDVRLFFSVMEKLGLVLDLIHLDRFPDALKSLIHTEVEIPVLGHWSVLTG